MEIVTEEGNQTRFEEVWAALDPKFRKKLSIADDIVHPGFARTPSYGLNRALNGGLQYGRQALVWGSKSAGKSSVLLQMLGMAQEEGRSCAWVDAEMSFDIEWAKRLGVDTSRLIVSPTRTIAGMVDDTVDLMKAKTDIIVVDSISALIPQAFLKKDSADLKHFEDTRQIGSKSRDLSDGLTIINAANNVDHATLFIIISQSRTNIGAMYSSQGPQGGQAVKFYSSNIIKLFSSESEKQTLKGQINVGDKILEEQIGRKVRWELEFSKTSPSFQEGEYDFYFRGQDVGVDSIADLVDTSLMLGFIDQTSPGRYEAMGEKFHGRPQLVAAVKENLDIQEALIEKVSNAKV